MLFRSHVGRAVHVSAVRGDAVVEDGNFAKVTCPWRHVVVDPMAIVLIKEFFVVFRPLSMGFGVAPAPKQLTWCEIIVIDDPKLIEGGHTQHEMLEVRVVVDGIDVKPIARLTAWGAVVQIDLLNRLADNPLIGETLSRLFSGKYELPKPAKRNPAGAYPQRRFSFVFGNRSAQSVFANRILVFQPARTGIDSRGI